MVPETTLAFYEMDYREKKKQKAWNNFALALVSAGISYLVKIIEEDQDYYDYLLEKLDDFFLFLKVESLKTIFDFELRILMKYKLLDGTCSIECWFSKIL